jgi:predicted RNA-binding Zn-ribbon protein involved in translation (DUF1610 family)
MSDVNHAVPVACPHCGDPEAKRMPVVGDYFDYHCPTCGDFTITGTEEAMFQRNNISPSKGRFVLVNGRRELRLRGEARWQR